MNNSESQNANQAKGTQPKTADDISNDNQRTAFDAEHMGDGVGIGNEDFEEDGGADLGFGETDETEDKDRDSPLRRDSNGGSTADGRNEHPEIIDVLSGKYDRDSSSAGGSGAKRK
jgi:hypothetical protein